MNVSKSDLSKIRDLVYEALGKSRMATTNFNRIDDDVQIIDHGEPKDPTTFIRERTRLWRRTYLENPLENAAEIIDKYF